MNLLLMSPLQVIFLIMLRQLNPITLIRMFLRNQRRFIFLLRLLNHLFFLNFHGLFFFTFLRITLPIFIKYYIGLEIIVEVAGVSLHELGFLF
jgi:hypothetical protein